MMLRPTLTKMMMMMKIRITIVLSEDGVGL